MKDLLQKLRQIIIALRITHHRRTAKWYYVCEKIDRYGRLFEPDQYTKENMVKVLAHTPHSACDRYLNRTNYYVNSIFQTSYFTSRWVVISANTIDNPIKKHPIFFM